MLCIRSIKLNLVGDTFSLVQAPIKVFGIEGRYAHALFSAASRQNAIDKVEKELADFQVKPLHYTLSTCFEDCFSLSLSLAHTHTHTQYW